MIRLAERADSALFSVVSLTPDADLMSLRTMYSPAVSAAIVRSTRR